MKLPIGIIISILSCITLVTGCWDMSEPNEIALWRATAIDLAPNGMYRASGQVLIPSKLIPGASSGPDSKTIVYSGTGINFRDAMYNAGKKMSRRIYLGHREAIFIGEKLSKHGVKSILDEVGRNPESNFQTKLIVIKGADAKSFLESMDPLEQSSTVWAVRSNRLNAMQDEAATVRRFQIDLLSDGIRPLLPVLELNSETKTKNNTDSGGGGGGGEGGSATKPKFILNQVGLFNKSGQLVGYLQDKEADLAVWVCKMARRLASGNLPTVGDFAWSQAIPNRKGTVSLNFTNYHRKLKSQIEGKQIKVQVLLTGTANIVENNSNVDSSKSSGVKEIENAINQGIKKSSEQMIKKVQEQFKTDIFGFGEDIHRRYPQQWKRWKATWDTKFPHVVTTVQVDMQIRSAGYTGRTVSKIRMEE
jgi:spore germination protein KC